MSNENSVSKKTLKIIEYVWYAFCLILGNNLKSNLDLNLWISICIIVSLCIIGQILIRKFIKVN